jgi:hypothetical protein
MVVCLGVCIERSEVDAALIAKGFVGCSPCLQAEITVSIDAMLQESTDSGALTLADIRRSGLRRDWKVRRLDTDPHGCCTIKADGTIESFSQW